MQIELTKVLSQDGNSQQQTVHLDINEICVQGERFPIQETIPAELTITNSGKGLLVIEGGDTVCKMSGRCYL